VKPKRRKSRWADSTKKKDLMHEKEMLMLSRSKKAKTPAVDEDKEELLNAMTMMAMWKQPQPLPEDKDNPPVHVDSNEVAVQTSRMSSIPPVTYADESAVPISPALLDEVEKALELTSRNTAPPTEIPFFTPQAPAPTNFSASMFPPPPPVAPSFPPPPPQPPMPMSIPPSSEATLETVLMMGLPLFLVGQNVQALQTLQASPGLLNAYKDQAGVYNQAGLISLVQTLTQNAAPPTTSQNQYTAAYQPSAVPFAQPPAAASHSGSGYRGDQNSGDANMHLSGYGPSTTVEDIINLFSPYVHVVEVVTKDKFSFVNTNDSEGAKRAREALNGALLGGMPCRINVATRKAKNPNHIPSGVSSSAATTTLPRNALGQVDYDQVRDDRGNAATKNLFIAGYGPGTTDQQLRDIVGTYANVLSVTNKGTYAFVNTESRESAVLARDALTGQTLNGSLLRINFAKETGRLGTSFAAGAGASASHGHYGR
jgi:RNA recognition motif-containing protein